MGAAGIHICTNMGTFGCCCMTCVLTWRTVGCCCKTCVLTWGQFGAAVRHVY